MSIQKISSQSDLPSVDGLLRHRLCAPLLDSYGHELITAIIRDCLAHRREILSAANKQKSVRADAATVLADVQQRVENLLAPSPRAVFNLTGTVLHTNLGRATLPEEAITAMIEVARHATDLEFDLVRGKRGNRNQHVEGWIIRLTGAEAALVVNNNAAALMLLLNTLARRKEVPVSRGELIEIGDSFRIPDVMTRADARLVEVGTTNRTHLKDFEQAIGRRTALLMKVHTSNFVVQGFTASVPESALAKLARQHDIPFVVDLGSGTLLDLTRWGLPREPTVAGTLQGGADLVTFSGDKLLGGPQAGIIAGRKDLIRRLKSNPMLRALRPDKITLAALAAVLKLYTDPDRLAARLPALRMLSRTAAQIEQLGHDVLPALQAVFGADFNLELRPCQSQVGSGSLPVDRLASHALCLIPRSHHPSAGTTLEKLARRLRQLPTPIIGRINDGAFVMDLRCLEDVDRFREQLSGLESP